MFCAHAYKWKNGAANEAIVLEEACNSTHIDGIMLSVIKDNVSS